MKNDFNLRKHLYYLRIPIHLDTRNTTIANFVSETLSDFDLKIWKKPSEKAQISPSLKLFEKLTKETCKLPMRIMQGHFQKIGCIIIFLWLYLTLI